MNSDYIKAMEVTNNLITQSKADKIRLWFEYTVFGW